MLKHSDISVENMSYILLYNDFPFNFYDLLNFTYSTSLVYMCVDIYIYIYIYIPFYSLFSHSVNF